MDDLVIGIDGGGTNTHVVAIRAAQGEPPVAVASAEAGPCNIAMMSVAEALGNVADGILRLGIDSAAVKSVCAGIAGFTFEERRRDFMAGLASLAPNTLISVIPDFVAAHIGATGGGQGITAIAGTGSVAYGRNRAGHEHRAGGYGYLIDDAGSGYGIGRRAIAAVLTAGDGSGPPTELTHLLRAELSSVVPAYLIEGVYGGRFDRIRIASLARQVAKAAELADSVALGILAEAGQAQARTAIAVGSHLFAGDESFPVALFGSVWNAGALIVSPFRKVFAEAYPSAEIGSPLLDAATGAAIHGQLQLRESSTTSGRL